MNGLGVLFVIRLKIRVKGRSIMFMVLCYVLLMYVLMIIRCLIYVVRNKLSNGGNRWSMLRLCVLIRWMWNGLNMRLVRRNVHSLFYRRLSRLRCCREFCGLLLGMLMILRRRCLMRVVMGLCLVSLFNIWLIGPFSLDNGVLVIWVVVILIIRL